MLNSFIVGQFKQNNLNILLVSIKVRYDHVYLDRLTYVKNRPNLKNINIFSQLTISNYFFASQCLIKNLQKTAKFCLLIEQQFYLSNICTDCFSAKNDNCYRDNCLQLIIKLIFTTLFLYRFPFWTNKRPHPISRIAMYKFEFSSLKTKYIYL